jgi:S-(hydroxymethyl)glutathione dehydrogenase / alcohol dehydrogenase
LSLLRPVGTLVIVGMPAKAAMATLPIWDFVANGQRILGSNMGSTRLALDIPWLVDLYQQGRLRLAELITAHYPLERINEAIAAMEHGTALRNVLLFPAAGAADSAAVPTS